MFLIVKIDFKPRVYFDAVPVGFKTMIVAVSFALLQNCRILPMNGIMA